MKKAYNKDIWRAIWKGKKRFLSIMVITTLGVAMFSALEMACVDLRYSADKFLDRQNLYDICVVSTLGITDEDISALGALEAVEVAEGAYSETVHMRVGESDKNVSLKTLSESGMNQPYLLEGELPQNANEIAITVRFQEAMGSIIGDTLRIKEELEEEEEPNFLYTEYIITAVVIDPMDLNNADGAIAFRSSSTDDYTLFVRPEAVESEVYTAAYLTLSGGKDMFCYGENYVNCVEDVADIIENEIKEQREQARYDEIMGEAYEELADAEAEAKEELADAEQELADAAQEITDGKEELADGERELREKEQEAADTIAEARAEIEDAKTQIADGKSQIEDAERQIKQGEEQLEQAKLLLAQQEKDVYTQFAAGRTEIETQLAQLESTKVTLEEQVAAVSGMLAQLWPATEWDLYVQALTKAYIPVAQAQVAQNDSSAAEAAVPGLVAQEEAAFINALSMAINTANGMQLDALPTQMVQVSYGLGQLLATEQVLNEQFAMLNEQEMTARQGFAMGWQEIADNEKSLAINSKQLADAWEELVKGEEELITGEQELNEQEIDAKRQIAEGWQEIADGKLELAEGESELADGLQEYEEAKAEVEQELADARKEIEDIDMAQWYVQDRTSLSGYANIKSDADSIEAIGTVFPIVFLVVAVLISLTTITRMVEEDRGLIGTYKALGFTDKEIRRKYLWYASSASAMGSILGNICGFIVLPGIIFIIFDAMYLLPEYVFKFDLLYGIMGPFIFILAIVGATTVACKTELVQMPAVLMRPKAPRSGSRVFLERIIPIWNHLSFLNKVTARNLFRYKKRLFMTIAGIMGCMALLLFGFAIKDSVHDLMPRQYEQVYRYDVMAVSMAEDNEKMLSYLQNDEGVESYVNAQIENVQLKNMQGQEEKVQLFVVPEDVDFTTYIHLENLAGETVTLKDGGVYITRNASEVLGFAEGDTLALQNIDLEQHEITVSGIVKNYLGNNIYMSKGTYEQLFGTYEPNGALIHLSKNCENQEEFAKELGEQEGVLTSLSTEELKRDFSKAFALINMVVYIVIIMAACLAFVVLFTLATTNISERQRELATIKVLGFFDREVHLYVNKETLILTGVGILCGVPLGYAFAQTLTAILRIPSMYLAVSLHLDSYLIAAGISFLFATVVNMITDRSLDKVDPVEALKSIE